ncbi:MAG: hypothetical protein U9N18_04550 [Campylobacterota bacterium]|nr:hypothetical protein [Campylobacterota bacterium]
MSIGISILIFFVSIIALVAEFFLYMILGVGASFSGNISTLTGLAFFFVGLMILTGAIGVLAPFCVIIGIIVKNKSIANKLFLIFISLIALFYFIGVPLLSSLGDIQGASSEKISEITREQQTNDKQAKQSKEIPSQISEEEVYIIDNLMLQSIHVDRGYGEFDMPGYSEPKKGLFGKIKNLGDKSIKYIKLTVYFHDKNGNRIFEKDYLVLNTDALFSEDSPLKPNYVKDIGILLEEDAPSDWGGKVDVEISKVKFADVE